MNPRSNPTWAGDWGAKVYGALRRQGFESMSDFLAAHPLDTYDQVAARLGPHFAPVQIEHLQFLEAVESGRMRHAASDALVRKLHEHLPRGWKRGDDAVNRAMLAYAEWAGIVETRAKLVGNPISAHIFLAVWRALERIGPPEGWLPSDARDDILVRAFAEGWPPEHAE